jgi:hypothetical protein
MVSHRPGCTVPQCAHTTDACHHQLRRVGNSPNCQDASVRPAPSLALGAPIPAAVFSTLGWSTR